jgi:hypothetical protein
VHALSEQRLMNSQHFGVGGEAPQPFECHVKLQTKRSFCSLENLDLSQRVADKAYEFLCV